MHVSMLKMQYWWDKVAEGVTMDEAKGIIVEKGAGATLGVMRWDLAVDM